MLMQVPPGGVHETLFKFADSRPGCLPTPALAVSGASDGDGEILAECV